MMTQREVREGSVADLVVRIARERSQAAATDASDRAAEVVSAASEQPQRWRPPARLFPGAPRRRPR
jgi:hypothetical protein